jgi:hypothetical protein
VPARRDANPSTLGSRRARRLLAPRAPLVPPRAFVASIAFVASSAPVALGCSPAIVVVPPVPAPLPAHPAAVAAGARWVFSSRLRPKLRVDLGGGETLLVDDDGRRAVRGVDGALREAGALVPPDTAAVVRRGDGKLAFLTVGGALVLADGPLAEPTATRRIHAPFRALTATRAAAIGVTEDGRLERSVDAGEAWSPVALDPSLGVAAARFFDLAARVDGAVLAIAAPQRAIASEDHGVAWTRLETPGFGLERVRVDEDGALLLESGDARARLERRPLRLQRLDGAPAPAPVAHAIGAFETVFPLGERVVHLRGEPTASAKDYQGPRNWSLAVSAIGEPSSLHAVPEADGFPRVLVGGTPEETLLLATWMSPADGARTKLLRSTDLGRSWAPLAAWPSAMRNDHVRFAAGPGGYVFVDAVCDQGATACASRVRPSGQSKFLSASFEGGDLRPAALAFDPAARRVYVVGSFGGAALEVQVASLDDTRFRRLSSPELRPEGLQGDVQATVDSAGTLRIAVAVEGGWLLHGLTRDGVALPSSRLPEAATGVLLAGDRALVNGAGRLWESADAGASWNEFPAPAYAGLYACGPLGCFAPDRARVGWALPVGRKGGAFPAPAPPSEPSSLPDLLPGLRCKRAGAPVAYSAYLARDRGRTSAFSRAPEVALEVTVGGRRVRIAHSPVGTRVTWLEADGKTKVERTWLLDRAIEPKLVSRGDAAFLHLPAPLGTPGARPQWLVSLAEPSPDPPTPTLVDVAKLLDGPACGATSKPWLTLRLEMSGASNPVLLEHRGEVAPERLGIDDAVVRVGPAGEACVAALANDYRADRQVRLAMDDLEHAWIFDVRLETMVIPIACARARLAPSR